jgi:hypothetical protein
LWFIDVVLSDGSSGTLDVNSLLDVSLAELDLTGATLLSSSMLFLAPSFLDGSDPNLSNI